MKIFSQEIFPHFNIMYLLDIEKGDGVDAYYDSDDCVYDDEDLCDNIYKGIWYVN